MSDLKFKVGDRVQFVRETYGFRTWNPSFDAIGLIKKIDDSHPTCPYVVGYDNGKEYWLSDDEIEAAEPRLRFKVGDKVRFVRETYKNRSHSLTEEVPFSTVGVVGNVDHDDDLRPYRVSFSDISYWMAADEIEAAEPRLRFKVGDRAKVVGSNTPAGGGPHGFAIGTYVRITATKPGSAGLFDYDAEDDDGINWAVMDADLSPIKPESDGTLSLLEAMQESERTGAEFEMIVPKTPMRRMKVNNGGYLVFSDKFGGDVPTSIQAQRARYRMCKSPLEELEERHAKELVEYRTSHAAPDYKIFDEGFRMGLRHAAERAELEGRK